MWEYKVLIVKDVAKLVNLHLLSVKAASECTLHHRFLAFISNPFSKKKSKTKAQFLDLLSLLDPSDYT